MEDFDGLHLRRIQYDGGRFPGRMVEAELMLRLGAANLQNNSTDNQLITMEFDISNTIYRLFCYIRRI